MPRKKLETKVLQNCRGINKVHYGLGENVERSEK